MEVEMRSKEIVSVNTIHLQKKNIHVHIINIPCKSKGAFTELRRESGVSIGVTFDHKHAL
jgi:hypothetical protein